MRITRAKYLFSLFLLYLYKISNKLKLPKVVTLFLYKAYYKYMQKILYPYLSKALNELNDSKFKGIRNDRIIWMFWWQGKKGMPLIVRKCIQSVKEHSMNHKVVIVDKYNLSNLTDIPKYIYKKVNKGYITFTHFSDIVRFNLLKNYGGLWIDATMYSPCNLDDSYFNNYLYTSNGYHNTNPLFVKGRWIAGLIGGYKDNSLFQFMSNYFESYWKNNTIFINYFLVDYGLEFAYNHDIGGFKKYVNYIYHSTNNSYIFKFIKLLDKPYNSNVYKKILSTTNLFNLTYKKKFLNNGKTFYSKLLSDKLYK